MADEVVRHNVANGSVTERWYDGARDDLVLLAPHGGSIEPSTAAQVKAIATGTGLPAWTCTGHSQTDTSAFTRFHVTSADISPNEYPLLAHAYELSPARAVSFHGMSNDGIKVGGRAQTAVKQHVCAALQEALPSSVMIESVPWGPYCGITRANIVNEVTASGESGIQIEQSRTVRDNHGETVSQTVVTALDELRVAVS